MSKYILALDQGTTSSRALVIDAAGAVLSVAQKELSQSFPQPGWVEHDPHEIWSSQLGVAAEAVSRAGITDTREIAAIGLTNQRETAIVWDRQTGQPIYPAIVWQDRRTASICEQMKADGLEELIQQKTGLVIDAYFSGTKVAWILDHVPGARSRAERGELAFGTVDSWLIWNLTEGQVHVTDETNASRTMLFNIHAHTWDDELLQQVQVPRAMLAMVRSSSEIYGESRGYASGIPIAGIAGDQQAALFGQMCRQPGMVKNTYGTGCFMLMNTGGQPVPSTNKLLTTIAWRVQGQTSYALEGSVFMAGAVVQWLRDGLRVIRSSAEVEALAASVPDNGGVYFVPAFAGLGAPHWDSYARGLTIGLTRGTTCAHLARAALEGIAYQVADVLLAMEKDAHLQLQELRVDGGAAANNLLMQFQADLLGIPVVRARNTETTAMGAAYLAGLAVGYYRSIDEIAAQWASDRVFEPKMSEDQRGGFRSHWDKALQRSKAWLSP